LITESKPRSSDHRPVEQRSTRCGRCSNRWRWSPCCCRSAPCWSAS